MIKYLKYMARPKEFAGRFAYKFFKNRYQAKGVKSGLVNNKINFIFELGLDPYVVQMYLGFYESDLTHFLENHLSEGDTFLDVGANIGYVTAYAASLVGQSGEVHSFEPVPAYFKRLDTIRQQNKAYKITTNQNAIGDKPGKAKVALSTDNLGFNTLVSGFMDDDVVKEHVEVDVIILDDYFIQKNINKVAVIKIDTEGFEFPVLKGMKKFLDAGNRPLLIVEVSPNAYPHLNLKLKDLQSFFEHYQYKVINSEDQSAVEISTLKKITNVLCIPQGYRS